MTRSSMLVLLALFGFSNPAHALTRVPFEGEPVGEAPRTGMVDGTWTSGNKQFFGTAYEAYDASNRYSGSSPTAPISRVWFTGTQGVLSEVYWPTIDTPQVRDSQFLVTDGKSFLYEERKDSITRVEWMQPGVPAFRVTNSDRQGRFIIERTIFTDPDSDVLIQHVKLTRNVPGLRFYLLHNPQVANAPMGNSALASTGDAPGAGLYAWQGRFAQAYVPNIAIKRASAGFVGASDGWQDLNDNFSMDWSYETATVGNVALMAWLDVPESVGTTEFDLALGFGEDIGKAYAAAQAVLRRDTAQILTKYAQQWRDYQGTVGDLGGFSRDGSTLFRSSVATLKSMEDKTFEGAFVASPTIPWGQYERDANSQITVNGSRAHQIGGYHLVWPRDLYNMATAFMAIRDNRSAIASLNYLKRVQFTAAAGEWQYGFRRHSKDGSFPQNVWVNGEPYWGGLQMDETAFPVVLAYRLWKAQAIDLADYWNMVYRAADFIQQYGPWSLMERWEEAMGASPSTIASEITALWSAAEMAERMGDAARARLYRATADAWSSKPGDNLETWTFTQTGKLGDGRYFARIVGASGFEEVWNPNSDQEFVLANGAGRWREKDIVDGGFLELVRLGVRRALDFAIQETLPEYDASIRVDLPGIGPGFRRYSQDRYNRDDATGAQTSGMLWPLLTGERGHYEFQRAIERGAAPAARDAVLMSYIETVEAMATPNHFIPEQVWDGGSRAGQSTGCATPLGWSHAEYIKLLRSRADQRVFDRLEWSSPRQ